MKQQDTGTNSCHSGLNLVGWQGRKQRPAAAVFFFCCENLWHGHNGPVGQKERCQSEIYGTACKHTFAVQPCLVHKKSGSPKLPLLQYLDFTHVVTRYQHIQLVYWKSLKGSMFHHNWHCVFGQTPVNQSLYKENSSYSTAVSVYCGEYMSVITSNQRGIPTPKALLSQNSLTKHHSVQ